MFFTFKHSCVFIFVDQNPGMVTFDCNFFAFWKTLAITFIIPLMAGPYEQTMCLVVLVARVGDNVLQDELSAFFGLKK